MPIHVDYHQLRQFASSRLAIGLAFLWGLSEAVFFFIVPDFFFVFMALFKPLAGIICGVVSILGTLVGGIMMYTLASLFPDILNRFLLWIPGIPPAMMKEVHDSILLKGPAALLAGPLGGIPYKVYAVQAGILHMSLIGFLLFTLLARLKRIAFVSGLAALFGKIAAPYIARRTKTWVISYGIFWIVFYFIYTLLLDRKYPVIFNH